MPSYELVLKTPGSEPTRMWVPENGLLIGRSEDCDIALPQDHSVSRHHARVYPKGDALVVEDLGSRNGIYVGTERHVLCHLHGGEEFRVGEQSIQVASADDTAIRHAVISAEHGTTIEEAFIRATSDESLKILFQAARLLGEMFEPQALCSEVFELIFNALPVRRGYIFTLSGEPAEPVVRASRSRSARDGGPPLSRTLIDHVFKSREAVLIHDAQADERFDPSASIIGHEIHSAMCAPLMGRIAPVGALYVDSGSNVQPFEREDLELLTAVARIVGIAIENAQLHEERVQHERLAAIGEATAGLGHCIKNIMTGVRGSGDMIAMAVANEEYRHLKTAWPIMSRCIDRIETLVMNMLSYSRSAELETMLTDLNSLVRESVETLRVSAEAKNVKLIVEETPNAVLQADGRELLRVVINLVANAVDACEKSGGEVTMKIQRDTSGLTLSVSDTGLGIPASVLPRIFDAFYTTKGSRGTGLGLACCQKIIGQHGGRIDVQSTEGEGTTFYVYLPFERKSGKATQSMTIVKRKEPDTA